MLDAIARTEPEAPRSEPVARGPARHSMFERARAYVAKMPPAISHQGGHSATWNVARKCAADFGLSADQTLDILREYNQRCEPPWSDNDLAHKAKDAAEKARISNPVEDRERHWTMPNEHFELETLSDDHTPDPPEGLFDDGPAPDENSEEPASVLGAHWIQLSHCPNLLTDTPPKTEWALTRWHEGREVGVFPRGKTGAVAAAGGVGKTMIMIQLAIAKATGGFWLDAFRTGEPEPVLLALAEEEKDEAQRRLWRACNAAELTPEQRALAARNIDILPLHGVPVALTCSPAPGVIVETPLAAELRDRLDHRGVDWGLIILDPFVRFMGGGVESNNEAATRGMQTIERLCSVRGRPAVVLAHHSSQVSARSGESDARGVTGITDALRWLATVDVVQDPTTAAEGLRLRNRKNNYSLKFPEMVLARNNEPGTEGTLRLASAFEVAALDPKQNAAKAKQGAAKDTWGAECDAVLAQVPAFPAHTPTGRIDAALRASGTVVGEKKLTRILDHLASVEGGNRIVDLSDGAQSKPRQWARKDGVS
jgi:hypothetical protein